MSKVGMMTTVITTQIVEAVVEDEQNEGCDISAGLFGIELSKVVRGLAQEQSMVSTLKEKAEHLVNACSLHGIGDIEEVNEIVEAIKQLTQK